MNDAQPSWFRENLFIVAAIALPIIVILFFLAATRLPALWVDDPKHDFFFAIYEQRSDGAEFGIRFIRKQGGIQAEVRKSDNNHYRSVQRLFRYKALEQSVVEIEFDVPEEVVTQLRAQPNATPDVDHPISVPVPLGPIELDIQNKAPDGYALHKFSGRNSGLVSEIFGMNRRTRDMSIAKGGRVVKIPQPAMTTENWYYYQSAEFLGWVVK